MGAIYLKPLDDEMDRHDVFYARYMDDWVVLAETRWKLRRSVKATNEVLERLKVKKHPYKTFVGNVRNGFDFLGYRLEKPANCGLGLAWMTISNHFKKLARLYEQDACPQRIGQYVEVWWRWAKAGMTAFVYPKISLFEHYYPNLPNKVAPTCMPNFLKHAIRCLKLMV